MNRACFPQEKHQNSQKWAKFMNFSFRPFLWFGLPGRLLRKVRKEFLGPPGLESPRSPTIGEKQKLGRRFGYLLFFLLGGGEGGSRRQEGGEGGRILIVSPRRGALPGERGGCLQRMGGGGAKFCFFLRGRNSHQERGRWEGDSKTKKKRYDN